MIVWAVVCVVAAALSVGFCVLTRRPLLSALLAALIIAVSVQILGRVQLGYFDPFWPVALVVSFGGSLVAAALAAIAWRRLHRAGFR